MKDVALKAKVSTATVSR
ncbi:LacI family DNA-binding transcriptional regulator, partial [Escherichia coli]